MEQFIVVVGKYGFLIIAALFIPLGLNLALNTFRRQRLWIKAEGEIVDAHASSKWVDNAAAHTHRYETFYTAVVEFASQDGTRHRVDAAETKTKPQMGVKCLVRYEPGTPANALVSTPLSDWMGPFLYVAIGCVLLWLSVQLFWSGAFS